MGTSEKERVCGVIRVGFKKLTKDAFFPTKAHPTDSGFDLYASETVIIEPGKTKVVKTGIAIKLPPGYEAQVRPRSGVTSKTKLRVQLGTIDNEYTGEIRIIVDNARHEQCWDDGETLYSPFNIREDVEADCGHHVFGSYIIRKGDKLAQLVIQPIPAVEAYEIHELPETERGKNGFGSTGY